MRKLLLGLVAIALISLASLVVAQTADEPAATERKTTTTVSTSPEHRGTALRLAAMDTSLAALRKLDVAADHPPPKNARQPLA
jgi:hypothetical protein